MVAPQSLHLPLPIDIAAAHGRPFFLARSGVLPYILNMNVGEKPLYGLIPMRIRHFVQHRGVAGIPIPAQARRGDLLEERSHFPASPDVAGMLVFEHENDIV